jgi:hypothetical protein
MFLFAIREWVSAVFSIQVVIPCRYAISVECVAVGLRSSAQVRPRNSVHSERRRGQMRTGLRSYGPCWNYQRR